MDVEKVMPPRPLHSAEPASPQLTASDAAGSPSSGEDHALLDGEACDRPDATPAATGAAADASNGPMHHLDGGGLLPLTAPNMLGGGMPALASPAAGVHPLQLLQPHADLRLRSSPDPGATPRSNISADERAHNDLLGPHNGFMDGPPSHDQMAAMLAAFQANRAPLVGLPDVFKTASSPSAGDFLVRSSLKTEPSSMVKSEPSLLAGPLAPPSPPVGGPENAGSPETNSKAGPDGKDKGRRFFCQYCSKGFSLMNVLKVHERIHTGEKPYVCDICHKAFNQSGSLNRHKNTHLKRMEGNRANKCRFCDKQFLYSSQLQDHEATAHRQELNSSKPSAAATAPPPPPPPMPTSVAAAAAAANAALSNNLVAQAIASSIMASGGQQNGAVPGMVHTPVSSGGCGASGLSGADAPLMNHLRVIAAAAAAKQVEDQEVTCKSCGKKCLSKEQLIMHEQEHYMSNLSHIISVMASHPGGHNLGGLPMPPQAAAAAAALNSLSRFPSLNGGGGGANCPPGGAAQLPGGAGGAAAPLPPTLQQFLQLHFQSLAGPGKPPLGVIGPPSSSMQMLSSAGSNASSSSSNDENRSLAAAAKRSLLTAVPPLPPMPPTSAGGMEGLDGVAMRLSPPTSLSMSSMLAPLTLDVGNGPFSERMKKEEAAIASSPNGACSGASSGAGNGMSAVANAAAAAAAGGPTLPPPRGVHPMILSGHHLRCSMCDRHFDNAAKLHLHMRSHDTEDGQKVCLVCKKTFNCASALKIHYRRHSGERPYSCRFCRKAFSQNGTLKRHYTTCKEARNLARMTEQVPIGHHRHHLQPRNSNVLPGAAAALAGVGIASCSGDSCGESTSGHEEEPGQKMMGPTPPPPKETLELVAHGFDLVDGPQDLSMVSANCVTNGNDAGRPLGGGEGGALSSAEEADLVPRSRKRKFDEARGGPVAGRPQSDLLVDPRDPELRPIGQLSLHEIMRYLTERNKLYRCEHCQIFFLDSALYYMHRSVHTQGAPLRCAICGYEATEKYNFHSHLMDHNKVMTAAALPERPPSRSSPREEEMEEEEEEVEMEEVRPNGEAVESSEVPEEEFPAAQLRASPKPTSE